MRLWALLKPHTDDVRNSPSLTIARALTAARARVSAFDPVAKEVNRRGLEALEYAPSISDCLFGAQCAILVAEWEQFKALTQDDFIAHVAAPGVIDAR